jgi:hypothetical protein
LLGFLKLFLEIKKTIKSNNWQVLFVVQRTPQLEGEVRGVLERDRELRQALQRSRRIGDMLLKAEAEELSAVEQFAQELMQREYMWALCLLLLLLLDLQPILLAPLCLTLSVCMPLLVPFHRSAPSRGMGCQAERQACMSCYQQQEVRGEGFKEEDVGVLLEHAVFCMVFFAEAFLMACCFNDRTLYGSCAGPVEMRRRRVSLHAVRQPSV